MSERAVEIAQNNAEAEVAPLRELASPLLTKIKAGGRLGRTAPPTCATCACPSMKSGPPPRHHGRVGGAPWNSSPSCSCLLLRPDRPSPMVLRHRHGSFGLYAIVEESRARRSSRCSARCSASSTSLGSTSPWSPSSACKAFLLPVLRSSRQVVSTALRQHYLRSQMVNSEEGTPMGVGIWYEMARQRTPWTTSSSTPTRTGRCRPTSPARPSRRCRTSRWSRCSRTGTA